MRYIAHRGNINGINSSTENLPSNILRVISLGYDVEIDLRAEGGKLKLGHDSPQYEIDFEFLIQNRGLWIHCKNIDALYFLMERKEMLHSIGNRFFWHQNDDVALTSDGYFFTYPGKPLTDKSIAVMPEWSVGDDFEKCCGVCSDFVENIKNGNYSIENGRIVPNV